MNSREGLRMINLIKWLIFGHTHKYEIIDTLETKSDGYVIARTYVMRCKSCGKLKSYTKHA